MLQFIVLMTIMAIWALTSLLSREAQPLPPRPTRGPNSEGPRSAPPISRKEVPGPARYLSSTQGLSPNTLDRRTAPPRPAPVQGLGASGGRLASGRPSSADEGIVILESDIRNARNQPVLSPANPRQTRASQSRRGGRGRAASPSSPTRSQDPAKPRALTSFVTQSMAQTKARPLEITPLSSPLNMLSAPLTEQTVGALVQPASSGNAPAAFDSSQLRVMFAKPNKLREIAVLTEVLGRPLALRGRARMR